MREQQNSQRSESQTLTSQSQAMLNLNMKLQSTVLKGHVKTIDLELRKLDAVQAVDRLDIIKPYLPSSFFDADSDAVDALLFFERLSYKAAMLSNMIDQIHNISESLDTVVPESLVVYCEVRCRGCYEPGSQYVADSFVRVNRLGPSWRRSRFSPSGSPPTCAGVRLPRLSRWVRCTGSSWGSRKKWMDSSRRSAEKSCARPTAVARWTSALSSFFSGF
jgi:hypothetical protein